MQEFGITAGGFTNFPANKNYLKENISVFYIAPYLRIGRHEFTAGIVYPLTTQALCFSDYNNIHSRLGALAGYKFYIFNVYYRENLFVHYSFQYLRFAGTSNLNGWTGDPFKWKETDMYINNVIGIGYNLFFDTDARFGLYFTLDYVISQAGYKLDVPHSNKTSWATQYIWNNLSTHIGLGFKIT